MKKSSFAASIIIGIVAALVLSLIISIDIALFAGFVITIACLIYSDRKSVRLESVVIIRRTKKGRDFIDRTAKSMPNFWRRISYVGIALAVIAMVGGSLLMITMTGAVISGAKEGGVKLLLPGPVSSPVNAPVVYVVPWWIWIIGIMFVIIPHEFMHGIMCRIDGIRIKSVGWLLLFVIPGAFVEPDEKQLAKASRTTKLRVYAAGSFANMIVACIVLLVAFVIALSFSATSIIMASGVHFSSFSAPFNESPAYHANMTGSIIAINNIAVKTPENLSYLLSGYKPGDVVEIKTIDTRTAIGFYPSAVVGGDTHTYSVRLSQRSDGKGAFIGISKIDQAVTVKMDTSAYFTISVLLYYVFLFSFGIGLVNLLPIKPLDGGLIFEELVSGIKYKKIIVKAVSMGLLFLLLFNLVGPLFL